MQSLNKNNARAWKAKIRDSILDANLLLVLYGPGFLAIGISLASIFLIKAISPGVTAEQMSPIFATCSLMIGLSGIFEIFRKEVPGPFGTVLTGKIAIVSGILLVLFCWGMSLALIILSQQYWFLVFIVAFVFIVWDVLYRD